MSYPEVLRSKFGTHVTGVDYWPGEPDVDQIVGRLLRGESVKIFGLRRIGKSSLLFETKRRLEGSRPVIRLDGQELHSIPAFLKAIFDGLPRDRGPIRHMLEWVRKAGLPPEVKAKAEALITERILGNSEPDLDAYAELLLAELGRAIRDLPEEQRPVLFVDELPFFCDNVLRKTPGSTARVNALLAQLRAWRGEDYRVAQVLCGSFSLAWLQREHGVLSDHVNDPMPANVEELSRVSAEAMVAAMIAYEKKAAEPGFVAALLDRLPSLYPGVVQFAFSVMRLEPSYTLERLAHPFAHKIAEGLDKNYYAQFDKRFDRYTTDERRAAEALFRIVSAAAGAVGKSRAEEALGEGGRRLLDHLCDDGFLSASRQRGVRFASGLARHWFEGAT